jgi:hypothetical protein
MKIQRWAIALTLINFVLLVITLFVLLAQAKPTEAAGIAPALRARSLELVDESGEIRAQINVEATGEVILRMRDEEGNIRVKLGTSIDGSGFVLMNDTSQPGVQMIANSKGTTVTLTTKAGEQEVITP